MWKESHKKRDESLKIYTSHKENLMKHKAALFKEKKVEKWGLPAEEIRKAVDVINDAERAFTIMLPDETKKGEYLAEESAYFTN